MLSVSLKVVSLWHSIERVWASFKQNISVVRPSKIFCSTGKPPAVLLSVPTSTEEFFFLVDSIFAQTEKIKILKPPENGWVRPVEQKFCYFALCDTVAFGYKLANLKCSHNSCIWGGMLLRGRITGFS